MVQMSSETAQLLSSHGKEDWFCPRENAVEMKGKGSVKTFWLRIPDRSDTGSSNDVNVGEKAMELVSDKVSGLIRWNIEVLSRFGVHIRFDIGDIELFEFMYGWMLSTLFECGSRF